jgi:lipopolysaccharide/colanic/teichoic acid biosynthesis glycosyltransferase
MSSESDISEVVPERATVARGVVFTRLFDFICALGGLIFLAPLFGVIALAIKLGDGGPVFFAQNRIGKNFRQFQFYKFRSMVEGSDREDGLTAPGDSRITRIGRIVRRFKLDELPQLFNVLKGDMQLVGSRPEVDRYVQMFRQQYAVILQDRPGITDPASLAFRHEDRILRADRLEQQYVDEVLPAKLALALEYQRKRTFRSDLSILFRTLFRVLE